MRLGQAAGTVSQPRGLHAGAITLALALAILPASARLRGRPLEDVLDDLRGRGLSLIYSSAVVEPSMVVLREPKEKKDPRKILDEILAPLGLEAKDDRSGAILIVRAAGAAPNGSAPHQERPKSAWVEDIVVTPGRHEIVPQDVTATRTLDGRDVTISPTLGSDPVRAVSLLPGIASSDASAAFYPRGAEAKDVAMILDGLELYDPFHLDGFLRPFSFIDGRSIESVSVTAGGFTAERGDRNGGFVEMSTAAASDEETIDVEVGTLNSRLAYATPTPLGPLLVSGRYWYPEAVSDSIAFASDGLQPALADVYVKGGLLATPTTVLTAHALLAADRATLREPDTLEQVDASSRTGTVWLRHVRAWSSAITTDAVVSYGSSVGNRDGVADPEDLAVTVRDEHSVNFAGLRADATWAIDPESELRGGIEGRMLGAEMAYVSGTEGAMTALAAERSGASLAAYAAYRRTLARPLTAEAGLRWDRQTYTGDRQWSPRLNLAWRPGDRDEVRLAAGRFAQSVRIHELRLADGETTYRPPELSEQLGLTYGHRFQAPWTLRIDAYIHRLSNVHPRYENLYKPVELFPEAEPDRVLVAPESARLEGIELAAGGDPRASLTWLASYTWSSATDLVDGRTVPRSWDQPHAGKVLVAYRWQPGWFVAADATVHTGWPTTPVTLVAGEPVAGPRNSARLPTYARLDLKGGRTIETQRGSIRLELSVLNATDRDNACCLDEVLPTGVTYDSWLGITPAMQVVWRF
ncbi:MAG TPA: TonB-dependent receptor [Candidatus Polarisedimenticolaceae bacterium]|nr:TonB-dependent receptor [Candidatus Polarisedimenticolaceae bacterium]